MVDRNIRITQRMADAINNFLSPQETSNAPSATQSSPSNPTSSTYTAPLTLTAPTLLDRPLSSGKPPLSLLGGLTYSFSGGNSSNLFTGAPWNTHNNREGFLGIGNTVSNPPPPVAITDEMINNGSIHMGIENDGHIELTAYSEQTNGGDSYTARSISEFISTTGEVTRNTTSTQQTRGMVTLISGSLGSSNGERASFQFGPPRSTSTTTSSVNSEQATILIGALFGFAETGITPTPTMETQALSLRQSMGLEGPLPATTPPTTPTNRR